MLVYTARIEVPESATYHDIIEAQLKAEWNCVTKETVEDRMKKTDLDGKCGSCKWFKACTTGRLRSYGDCENVNAPITVRWSRNRSQTCKEYERKK